VPGTGSYRYLGLVREELERLGRRSCRCAGEGEFVLDCRRVGSRSVVKRYIDAGSVFVTDRIGFDGQDVHFLIKDSFRFVASGNQIETIDRLVDEGIDRCVVKVTSGAIHDLPAHLFRYVENFGQRANRFVGNAFEFGRIGSHRVRLQVVAVT
jgi:hypothetical protein